MDDWKGTVSFGCSRAPEYMDSQLLLENAQAQVIPNPIMGKALFVDCFQVLVITNNAAMNIVEQVSL